MAFIGLEIPISHSTANLWSENAHLVTHLPENQLGKKTKHHQNSCSAPTIFGQEEKCWSEQTFPWLNQAKSLLFLLIILLYLFFFFQANECITPQIITSSSVELILFSETWTHFKTFFLFNSDWGLQRSKQPSLFLPPRLTLLPPSLLSLFQTFLLYCIF